MSQPRVLSRWTKPINPFGLLLLIFITINYAQAQNWSTLGGGVNGWVYASTVYNGELIVGGSFSGAGGVFASHIARWNGATWDSLGSGLDGDVFALAVYNNELWAGGQFFNAGAVPVSYIAKWNGSAWSDPEGGMDGRVVALAVYNGNLIAGGYFTTANVTANYIAQWDGHAWSPLGAGMGGRPGTGQVMALASYNTDLIAAGFFTTAGGVPASHIAKWNGSSWDSLGSGIGWETYALTVYNGDLIAGGLFSSAGGVSAHDVARWNGSSWDSLGTGIGGGLYGYVLALTVRGTDLIAGGIYTTAGGANAANIASWNGTAWTPMATTMTSGGTVQGVFTLTTYAGDVIAGGIFDGVDGVSSGNVARWGSLTDARSGNHQNPTAYKLYQNYPNPFNPSTAIRFDLPALSFVSLRVFDILGQEVSTLLHEELRPGSYAIPWNASHLSSGVYFCRMNTGSFSQAKKLLLVR